jgi:enolase
MGAEVFHSLKKSALGTRTQHMLLAMKVVIAPVRLKGTEDALESILKAIIEMAGYKPGRKANRGTCGHSTRLVSI